MASAGVLSLQQIIAKSSAPVAEVEAWGGVVKLSGLTAGDTLEQDEKGGGGDTPEANGRRGLLLIAMSLTNADGTRMCPTKEDRAAMVEHLKRSDARTVTRLSAAVAELNGFREVDLEAAKNG
jgi:hypothetical protein